MLSNYHNTSLSHSAFGTKKSNWKPKSVPKLTVDVYRNDFTIYIVSTVAGVEAKNLDISLEGNTLCIRGIREKPYSEYGHMVLLEECFWGEFYREITINENLDFDAIKASLKEGLLIIEIPILNYSQNSDNIQIGL